MADAKKKESSLQLPLQRTNGKSLTGKIMWLPGKKNILTDLIDPVLDDGAYTHPVVIMSRIPSPEGLVGIFMVLKTLYLMNAIYIPRTQ
ncbi:uncharacterized protein ColSpa_09685 [Colletotrichum spaethianum]|uniref:Uncharacterized protein n=1 Tax=Colletotrichum spaethianum TaxID=700344 RepID=A0AA37PC68_9PEZI|nr:uncharacterized protein ColSpa_09685 [Colletotrichum spaethianum]GKT49504.1 hypothetical protein ColSpa_09685 [Colletotrichum spaethianum]